MAISYRSLDDRNHEFRLLELLPVESTSKTDTVKCRIFHVKQDDAPPYRTLSYVWGDASVTSTILAAYDGNSCPRATAIGLSGLEQYQPIEVTLNLELALRHLALELAPIYLWVDALCIDQSDNREKTSQVQRMTSIYHHAQEVNVWLGPEADSSNDVIEILEEIGNDAEGLLDTLSGGSIYDAVRMWEDKDDTLLEDGQSDEHGNAAQSPETTSIQSFLQRISGGDPPKRAFPPAATSAFIARPWWRRIWVLQEICVAQSVRFHCGHKHIRGSICFLALEAFAGYWQRVEKRTISTGRRDSSDFDREMLESNSEALSIWRRLAKGIWAMDKGLAYDYSDSGQATLMDDASRYTPKSTNPTDDSSPPERVNLSTLANWCVDQPGCIRMEATDPRDRIFALLGIARDRVELNITPDYSQSVEDVYIRTAAAFLRTGDFSPWYMHQTKFGTATKLPSWAVDWSAEFRKPSTRLATQYRAGGDVSPKLDMDYGADGLPCTVSIEGYEMGRIKETGPTWPMVKRRLPRQDRQMFRVSLHWLRLAHGLLHDSAYWTDGKESTCSTIYRLAKYDFDGEKLMFGLDDKQLFETCKVVIGNDRMMIERLRKEVSSLAYITKRNASSRRLFVTDTARAGMAPSWVQHDDVVVVFLGVNTPFILRAHHAGGHRLVGACAVHGIMAGEAVTGAQQQPQKFLIR